jgi:hypothetical protein
VNASRTLAGGFPSSAIPGFKKIHPQMLQPHAAKVLSSSQIRTLDIRSDFIHKFPRVDNGFSSSLGNSRLLRHVILARRISDWELTP